ncbi:MAG: DHH family phosphoesterase, partial [Coprococcus sp.]
MDKEIEKYIKEPVWSVYAKRADFFKIGEKYGIDPVIARVIRNRDIISDADIDMYINGDIDMAHEPSLMKDMEKGCMLMKKKLGEGKHVRIISDYDVDGVMSGYILYMGLRKVADAIISKSDGKSNDASKAYIDYDIPHRIRDGYGINNRMVDKAYAEGVDTIITCDNGIAANDAVNRAKELKMTVIVTDHHDIPYEMDEDGCRNYLIPAADAVIDHKQQDCAYPFKELCGAGVAYKFIQLLYRLSGIPEEECQEFVEYLGIATVCDVMNLVDENRIFVKKALDKLTASSNYGLAALIRNSGREGRKLTSFDLGFIIGPCINAAGRLGDARESMEFLLERDSYRAEERAIELININNERKSMTIDGTKQ